MTEITVIGAGGEYMESVVVVEWHKKVGDPVITGDLVVTVETAKAATEIEATADGVLSEIIADVGEEIPVGSVLGIIGDSISEKPSTSTAPQAKSSEVASAPFEGFQKVESDSQRIVASPLARRVAQQRQVNLAQVKPSSPPGRIRLRDVEAYASAVDQERNAVALETSPPQAVAAATSSISTKLSGGISIQRRGAQQGEKVVFLHGFGGDSLSWQPLLSAIGGGIDTILVDLPAHGRSGRPEDGLSVHQMAEAVSEALVEAKIDGFHLVGHSLGGAVSLALIARGRLSIRSLTLLAPAGLGPEIDGGFITGFARATRPESLSPWLTKLFADPAFVSPAFVAATMQARSDAGLRDAQLLIGESVFPDGTQAADFRDVLKTNLMPQKIIWGEQDRIIPMQHALRTGGQAALHFLPGVGHMPQVEAPVVVGRLLMQNIRCAS